MYGSGTNTNVPVIIITVWWTRPGWTSGVITGVRQSSHCRIRRFIRNDNEVDNDDDDQEDGGDDACDAEGQRHLATPASHVQVASVGSRGWVNWEYQGNTTCEKIVKIFLTDVIFNEHQQPWNWRCRINGSIHKILTTVKTLT